MATVPGAGRPNTTNFWLRGLFAAALLGLLGTVVLGGLWVLRSRGHGDSLAGAPVPSDPEAAEPGAPRRTLRRLPVEPAQIPRASTGPADEPAPPGARPEAVSPSEERDRVIGQLRASGPDARGLTKSAASVFAGWSAKVAELAALGADGAFGSLECHGKGCFATAVHGSELAADRAMDVITRTGEFHGWQSGKMRSGVITRADGKVEVTWVLYAPEPGQNALASTLPPDNLDELRAPPPNR